MNILFILLVISSAIILLLNVLLFWSIMAHSKAIAKNVAAYKRELREVFGRDDYKWASNFREYKDNANEAYEKVIKLEQLEVIKEAKKLQQLQQLEWQKENVDRELKRLKND